MTKIDCLLSLKFKPKITYFEILLKTAPLSPLIITKVTFPSFPDGPTYRWTETEIRLISASLVYKTENIYNKYTI